MRRRAGTARQIAYGTFDNFNTVVGGIKGSLATGIDLVYETLLVSPMAASASCARLGLRASPPTTPPANSLAYHLGGNNDACSQKPSP
jgi:microcin C transport system substrate-binding protein